MYHFPLVVLLLVSYLHRATAIAVSPYIRGFDISQQQLAIQDEQEHFWNCTYARGFRKFVIRGYREACGRTSWPGGGGKVDEYFIQGYHMARAAGYTWEQIDTYMVPCTNTPNKSATPCRSVDAQLTEFTKSLGDNGIKVHRLWLNIEQAPYCESWNGSPEENRQLASHWVAAISNDMLQSGRKWGVYAPNHVDAWTNLFGNGNVPIAPHLPFWGADNKNQDPRMSIFTTPIVGGWRYMVAKQYNTSNPDLGDKGKILADGCGTSVDLDSFDPAYQPVVSSPESGLGQAQSCQTTGDGLRYRPCPHVTAQCPAAGQYPSGTSVDFICQTTGDPITGHWNTNSWGRTKNGYYVSLAFVDQNCAKNLPSC